MTVLEGEGSVPILYGTYSLPVGRSLPAHIARPDLSGTHPTIVVAHTARGLTSHVKALCRHLARHGFAVISPDLYRGDGVRFSDLDSAIEAFEALSERRRASTIEAAIATAQMPGTEWAADEVIGLLALGHGGIPASAVAAGDDDIDALVLCYTPTPGLDETLASTRVPLLGVYGIEDERVPADEARQLRSTLGRGEFRFYSGAGHEFLDDGGATYDPAAADDALERVREFFAAHLGLVAAA